MRPESIHLRGERNLAGNAMDFHVQVVVLSFHDAMQAITEHKSARAP